MAKRGSLLDEVKSVLPRKGPERWYLAVPPDVAAELAEVKRLFNAGELGTKTGLATALSKTLTARGVKIGTAGVTRWLEET